MLTSLCLLVLVGVLIMHEYMVVRGDATGFRSRLTRRSLLLGLVGFAVAIGARGEVATAVRSALNVWDAAPAASELAGDPFLRGALEGQRPEHPFPEEETSEA